MASLISLVYPLFIYLFVVSYIQALIWTPPEDERIQEYHNRNHTWPLPFVIPSTEGWDRIMRRRLKQVQAMETRDQRFTGLYHVLNSAWCIPSFTETGWGLTRLSPSDDLTDTLLDFVVSNMHLAESETGNVDPFGGPTPPDFVKISTPLKKRVTKTLQPILEAWSGQSLTRSSTYGFRLYRNQSQLWMHTDKPGTHIISAIYHVGSSSNDGTSWPILVEGFDGETVSVILTPGDLLFYESAKVLHGRPIPFDGEWYTSVFVHFYPKGWRDRNHDMDAVYAIPPRHVWNEVVSSDSNVPKLEMIGTNFLEIDCPNNWCNSLINTTTAIEGPGTNGMVLTSSYSEKKSSAFDSIETADDSDPVNTKEL